MSFLESIIRTAWKKIYDDAAIEIMNMGPVADNWIEFNFLNMKVVLATRFVRRKRYENIYYVSVRIPFKSSNGFKLKMYDQRTLAGIVAKIFAVQDIEIGDSKFDRNFIIQSDDENKVIRLFSGEHIKAASFFPDALEITIDSDYGFWATTFPEGAKELCVTVSGITWDTNSYKSLFKLSGEVLITLIEMGIVDNYLEMED